MELKLEEKVFGAEVFSGFEDHVRVVAEGGQIMRNRGRRGWNLGFEGKNWRKGGRLITLFNKSELSLNYFDGSR